MSRMLMVSLLTLVGCPKTDTPEPAPEPVMSAPAAPEPDPSATVSPPPDPLPTGQECAQEIALQCGTGSADGCLSQKTTHHVCVPDTAVPGPPCEQEIGLVCPEGQVDACTPPRVSDTHLCVIVHKG
jgi:hypothetical protein